ncbi:asparagine synthetase B [Novosphingobium sp. CECT 9465]|uniref:asparagine synthetase B family protein n=1 Tax=Novosphingobium sp. CECT 9465 TaxID=2829794 RepID=UPI001E36F053|nr:asparagine synthase-related protein [Novosphingobium sp. CECT 9465]CAH0497582.1 Amidophosphoribosyltransferase [Novosphingobium sp. CECT 9465]
MSGFAAIVRFDNQPVDEAAIHRMTAAMDFRAHDGIRHEIGKTFALGHCMFHTTAESLEASQPLVSSDGGLVIAMDGWLANPDELREQLLERKARLRNRSDAELILHAYETWGEDCAIRIEGEFAFVIRDGRTNTVFCAKDHVSMRPFHYHWDGRRLVVASDIAAVLAAGDFARKLNPDQMAEQLASEFYSLDETVWTGVMRLPLASILRVDGNGPKVRRYWTPPLETSIRYKREEEYYEHYREVLLDSVRRASRSQVPVACEVSGGHDSSAIFALARRLKEGDRLPAPDALGFTLSGVPGDKSDEIEYARDVGRFLGVPIHETPRTVPDLSWFARQIEVECDMPYFPNSQSMFAEVEMVRQHGCRVLLDGEGGDEFVGGSAFVLNEMLLEGNLGGVVRELRHMKRRNGWKYAGERLFRYGFRPMAPMAFDGAMRHLRRHRQPWGEHLGNGPHWASRAILERLAEKREVAHQQDQNWKIRHPVRRRLWRELQNPFFEFLRDLSARLVARLGIELRTPMYSRRYIEFIFGLPEQMRFFDGYGKRIHLGALRHDLPESVLNRRSKAEFSFTFDRQLQPLASLFLQTIPDENRPEVCKDGLLKLYKNYEETGEGIWELWRIYGWYVLKNMEEIA